MMTKLELFTPDTSSSTDIPMAAGGVSAGFPSPADDFLQESLDLNRALIRHPAATFFVRVSGESMRDDQINDGDLLVVDKSVEPYDGCVAVCYLDGEFTLKRVRIEEKRVRLMPSNENYKPIEISPDDDFTVWGVVRYVIKKV